MTSPDPVAAIEAVFRIEFARLVAGLTRYVGDVGLAEDLAQDALVDALAQWRADGVPRNPGAWLMTVGKRRAVDLFRRNHIQAAKYAQLGRDLDGAPDQGVDTVDFDRAFDDHIEDDLLRLIFIASHPVVPAASRTALTLRLLGGLSTAEIARAFLLSEATTAARITRAKKAIAKAGVAFEVPTGTDRDARLGSVLEVIYLIFNEGYSASAGQDWLRPALCGEAVRLARVLVALVPAEPEAQGLLALLEIQSSRSAARVGPAGEPVLLLDQDRRRWDRLSIGRGLLALDRAEALRADRGPYTLQAAIAACHARTFHADETDWTRLAELYAELARAAPSPIVELNRAVAVSMAPGPGGGPAAGLDLVDQLVQTGLLAGYHLLPSVRGDLLDRLGLHAEAAEEFDRAAALTQNAAERTLSARRAAASRRSTPATPVRPTQTGTSAPVQ